MTTVYVIPFQFNKAGQAAAPSVAPTVTVVDQNNNVLVSAGTALTQLSNLNVGAYVYLYTGAAGLVVLGTAITTDLTLDASLLSAVATPVSFAQGADNNVILSNGTYGNSAIETLLVNGTYGLSALATLVAAIKTITDQLRFTIANEVDSNALSGGMSATDLRTALGMASANMDTQFSGVPPAVWNVLTSTLTTLNSIGKLLAAFTFDGSGNVNAIKNATDAAGTDFSATEKASVTSAVPSVSSIQSGLATPTNITAGTITTVGTVTNGVTVSTNSDKTGYTLSAAGILAIWNQLTADIGIIANSFGKLLSQFHFTIPNQVDANSISGSAGITQQQVRDSMKLAPTAGAPAGGSVDALIEAIPTTPAPTTGQIDTELSGAHGTGLWGIGSASSSAIMNQVVANKSGSTVNYINLVTYNASWSGLTISSLWTKVYLTVKSATAGYQPDSAATLQVVVSNPANGTTDGISVLLSAIPTSTQRGYGSLSVDQVNGIVSVSLSDALDLSSVLNDSHSYDIKCLLSTGQSVVLVSSAKFIIGTTETNSIQ